jgi:hypothetical protein
MKYSAIQSLNVSLYFENAPIFVGRLVYQENRQTSKIWFEYSSNGRTLLKKLALFIALLSIYNEHCPIRNSIIMLTNFKDVTINPVIARNRIA